MSMLAGFDYAQEISNETITKLFKSTVKIAGVLLNPPFELTLPGGAHLLVDDLHIDLEGDDSMNIAFLFSQSTVILPPVPTVLGSRPLLITPLDGTLRVNVPLKLVRGFGNRREVSGNMLGAAVNISYSARAEQVIVSALTNTGIAIEVFKKGMVDAITGVVQNVPNVPFELGHAVVPGTDGKIDGDIQLSNLQMRCVGHPDRSRQALCLLGNFFAATELNGDRLQKTETAILPGQDFATTFSPRAVHSLLFCPSLAASLTQSTGSPVTVEDLPTSCGRGDHLSIEDVRLTELRDQCVDGGIHIAGSIEKSGTCYEATGTFSARMELAVTPNGVVTYKVSVDEPEIDVSIDWYCQLAMWALLGYLSGVVVADMEGVGATFAASVAKSVLTDKLRPGHANAGPLARSNARPASLSVTPAGMTIQGQIEIPVPFVDATKFISIVSIARTEEVTAGGQGVWTTKVSCQPAAKSYFYSNLQQKQTGTFNLKAKLVATPLTVTYFARGAARGIGDLPAPSGPPIELPAPSSRVIAAGDDGWRTVTVPNVDCMYPLPLGTGGTKVTQDVHLDYRISGTQIQIANRNPAEGNFFILLEGAVLDGTGTAPAGVNARPALWVLFEGDTVSMEDDYVDDQAECALKSVRDIPRNYIPEWKFEFDPSPSWRMFAQVRALKEMERRGELRSNESEMLFLQAQIAHGNSVTQAYRASSIVSAVDGELKIPFGKIVPR